MKNNYFDNVVIYSRGSISRQSDENFRDDKTFQNNNFDDLNSNSNKALNQRVNDNNNDNKKGFFNSLKGKIIISLIIFLIIIIVTTIILIILFKFKNLDNSSSNIEINYSSESSKLSDENNNSKENSNMFINSIEENSNENIEQNSEKDFNDNSTENNKQSSEDINIDNSSSNEENEENNIKFLGKTISLTHANRLNYEILGTISRNFPKNSSINEGLSLYPEYNVSSSFNGTDEEKEAKNENLSSQQIIKDISQNKKENFITNKPNNILDSIFEEEKNNSEEIKPKETQKIQSNLDNKKKPIAFFNDDDDD
jgi:hypothetical protein